MPVDVDLVVLPADRSCACCDVQIGELAAIGCPLIWDRIEDRIICLYCWNECSIAGCQLQARAAQLLVDSKN